MSTPACSDKDFIAIWGEHKSAVKVAQVLGITERNVHNRRRSIEARYGMILGGKADVAIPHQKARVELSMPDGHVVVFSDAHYYPGEPTTAHKGLVKLLKKIKPDAVICNGDAFDGSTISRHPRIGWDNKPTVQKEIEAVSDRLSEIEKVSNQAKLFWPLGNHDARYEQFLASRAPEYQGVDGFTLKDKFPRWIPCWAVMINGNTMVKHRYHNGIHAAYNNTLKAGTSIVTGHLHSLKVTPWSDYNGTRYGIDTGTLADPYGEQFTDYMEESPRNWRSGFAILTFKDGKLLPPELAQVVGEGQLFFRGDVIIV